MASTLAANEWRPIHDLYVVHTKENEFIVFDTENVKIEELTLLNSSSL